MLAPGEKSANPIDTVALRRAFGTFVTGVTVITTRDAHGSPRGMTANSFTSVSLDPPLLLVCVARSAHSFPAFKNSDSFAVNLLHERQADVSNLFASKSATKFDTVNHDRVHTGAPILADCLTWFDCAVHNRVDAGDHVVLIGEVKAFGTSPRAPLGFCRGRYANVKDPLPPGWLEKHDMIVGYLVEADGQLLLRADGKGGWTLPLARRRVADAELKLDGGDALTLVPEATFLYSVFDVSDDDPGYLVYRARLAQGSTPAALSDGFAFFPIAELPYDAIPTREINSMLRRYARESIDKRFGIYIDSGDGGRLAMVGEARSWVNLPNK